MKRLFFIILSLCLAAAVIAAAFMKRDTGRAEKWPRSIEARLSVDDEWRPCPPEADCGRPRPRAATVRCSDAGDTAESVLTFLLDQPQCVDSAIAEIRRVTPEDLAAAHLYDAERGPRPEALLLALAATEGANSDAVRFNRALAFEKLFLHEQAIAAWDEYLRHDASSAWAAEARTRRNASRVANGAAEWDRGEPLRRALAASDRNTAATIVARFPGAARSLLEELVLDARHSDAQSLADLIDAHSGDRYARDIVDAAMRPRSASAWEEARTRLRAARAQDCAFDVLPETIGLLHRAGSPLRWEAEITLLGCEVSTSADPLRLLRRLDALRAGVAPYPFLAARVEIVRGLAFTIADRHLDAIDANAAARALFDSIHDPQGVATSESRSSGISRRLGDREQAWRLAWSAVSRLRSVWHPKEQNNVLGAAMEAAAANEQLDAALAYQQTAVDLLQWSAARGPHYGVQGSTLTLNLAIALRELAAIEGQLRSKDAVAHLDAAARLIDDPALARRRDPLRMRLEAVRGRALLESEPAAAVAAFSNALQLAASDSATVRAGLLLERAAARRLGDDRRGASADVDEALRIVRNEEVGLLRARQPGEREHLWSPYFSRFAAAYRQRAAEAIEERDFDTAFAFSEQARGFEPLYLLLQSQAVPPQFRALEHSVDVSELRRALPAGFTIIQYVVLEDRTYAFLLSRDRDVEVAALGATAADVRRWVESLQRAAAREDRLAFQSALREPFTRLMDLPMERLAARGEGGHTVVIVPDGPLHGLPFPPLLDARNGEYLIEKAPLAVAGSTRLFLYAWMRDRALSHAEPQRVTVVGDPATNPAILGRLQLTPLPYARQEAEDLTRLYAPAATPLIGADATTSALLALAHDSTIIHFAGHAVANPQQPFSSYLVLAGSDLLPADALLEKLASLQRTRLVVLGACSTAGGLERGLSIGAEGMAPLVRPFIAANIPAVLGTLWNVNDDTTRTLLVSFHRHYRNGADVTTALQRAQIRMLRNTNADEKSALAWGGFQVIGYATSPFVSAAGTEESTRDHVHSEDSLQRDDGLHPQ